MDYKDNAAAKFDARPRRSKKFNSATSPADASRFIVKHNYHDHSHDKTTLMDSEDDMPKRKGPRGGVTVPFPTKLHLMLSKLEEEGLNDIVSWQPHGRCFLVHKPKEFVDEIMPTFFRQSKLTSFQRQLNLYGFSRITAGRDRGGYYHELFLRNKLFLCQNMTRIRIKGTGIKGKANPSSEPDFYRMPPILPEDEEENRHLEEELEAAMNEENRRTMKSSSTYNPKRSRSKSSKRRTKLVSKSMVAVKAYSMPAPMVSPETPEKPPLEHFSSPPVNNMRRRMSQNQTYDHLNPSFMAPPLQPGDDIMFEGQHFHYMDSLVTPAEAQPFALKPRSSSIVSLPLEQALYEPILTPSSSSSSLSEFFQQHEPAIDFNPATVFQEKDAEIIGSDRFLMIA